MKIVTVTELSALGKGVIGFVIALAGLFQIPAIDQYLTAAAVHHPHIAVIAGAVTTIAALLANPQVQKVLNITVPANSTLQATIQTPKETV